MSTKVTKKVVKAAAIAEKAAEATPVEKTAEPAVVEKAAEAPKEEVKEAPKAKAKVPAVKAKVAKKPVKVAEPEPEAEAEPVNEVADIVLPNPDEHKAKLKVAKGEVTIVGNKKKKVPAKKSPKASPRSPAKSPRTPKKSPPKRTRSAGKTPAKSTATKGRKASAAKKTKRVVRKGKGAKAVKPKRQHNLKKAPIDYAGVGIGPARVRKVLSCTALNPREAAVRAALLKAANRPVRPKPTKENPNPEMPEQGPQTPIDKLPPNILSVVREAEKVHMDSLMEEYERKTVSTYDKDKREAYNTSRKEAAKADNFNLHAFNLTVDKKFYDGFDAFCKTEDCYQLGLKVVDKKTSEEYDKYDQWTRAMALVNKLCTRLSAETRNILAAFLDNIVRQYATNGIYNCIQEGRSIVQLRHALTPTDKFDVRVPLDPFVRTLDNYQLALNWLEACRETREEVRRKKEQGNEVEAELPEYPNPDYDEDFDGYVVDICRSVRIHMSESEKVAANKEAYLNTSISSDFKHFCSYIIYEAILRVGSVLRNAVKLNDVKTVNEKLMYYALEQIHSACGIEFEPTVSDITSRLEKFTEWRTKRRAERKSRKNQPAAAEGDEAEEETEEAAEEADPEEAEAAEEEVAADEDADAEEAEAAEEEVVDEEPAEAEEEEAGDDAEVEYEEEEEK